ncbi:solute carrier family 12 member 9-like [Ambystoma mexicanum]|uniref:solute carrier family 12 member 9-like n=1 Tax=Ambystoma mexicanum TaxID=8296 RepID=UPI0037E7569C
MSERSPLLTYRLISMSTEVDASGAGGGSGDPGPGRKKLSTFFGVVVPTLLSMFSVVLFLRIGFAVGQAGLYETMGMFIVAYIIIVMTVLAVCAISTNGALDAGGAYYMISRALGPEFGGSIGMMFFLGNACASTLFVLGLVEAIVDTFGIPPGESVGSGIQVLPRSYWYEFMYGSVLLLFCLVICLVGASIYAKANFIIFLIVITVLCTVFISFFAVSPKNVPLHIVRDNVTTLVNGSFTGFKLSTLMDNLYPRYSPDYTTGRMMSFTTVFAVMFNGCTGIMAGSNISGDLKNPSFSIPRGTITAVIFTYIIYNLLSLMVSCTCDRTLLLNDYSFMREFNIWHPFVTIGIYSSMISASMSNMIGASRILYALAKDDLFGILLAPAKKTTCGENPWVAVLLSWFLSQLVLFSGKLNTIAAIVTIFFLLVYAAVDIACLALEWASAPNFRPTFRYFTWYTCLLGVVGCLIMMFLINPIYASATIAFMLVLLLVLHYVAPSTSWGFITQALIFHQVRKYLLMLDVRKDHVKFWRPQVLLMVSNPRSSAPLISFVNDLKKSGLFVLGHVEIDDLDALPSDPLQDKYDFWLQLVDRLNVKAFVNLTLSDSVRHGIQQLLFISGLGGMRPNTVVLGFYDNCPPRDFLEEESALARKSSEGIFTGPPGMEVNFPPVRKGMSPGRLSSKEYVFMIADSIKMLKNVVLARYFSDFHKAQAFAHGGKGAYVDVWPVNLLRPDSNSYVDTCSLFMLQMACVLTMVRSWKRAKLRLFLCMESASPRPVQEEKLRQLLKELRIHALIQTVNWDDVVALHWHKQASPEEEEDETFTNFPTNANRISDEYLGAVNKMILEQDSIRAPAVRFLYLPRPPADTGLYNRYLHQLDTITKGLGPTLLVNGLSAVMSTQL